MKEKRIWVMVAAGRTVFNPETGKNLGPATTQVIESAYWRRRIKAEDVKRTVAPDSATERGAESAPIAAVSKSTRK